jgi:hypothetical protein
MEIKGIFYKLITARSFFGLFLAVTTLAISYKIGEGFGYNFGCPVMAGIIFAFILFMSVDHTLGNTMPYATRRMFERRFDAITAFLMGLSLILLVATSISSIWSNPILSQFVFNEPETHENEIAEQQKTTLSTIDVLQKQVNIDRANLESVKQEEQRKIEALAIHREKPVQRQMLKYIKTGELTWAARENINEIVTKVKRQRKKADKAIQSAQAKLNESESALIQHTKESTSETLKIVSTYAEIDKAKQADHLNLKNNFSSYMWLAEVLSGGFYFLLSIIIAMIGVKHKIKEPERKSFAMFLSYASASLWNWFLSKLEKLFKIDLDGNGVIGTTGKPKETTTATLAPVSHASPLDGLALQRHLESEAANTKYRLEKDLELLRRENLELKQAKKSKPKNSKSSETPFSPKAPTVENSKLVPIDTIKGFQNLEQNARLELMKFSKKVLNEKHSLEKLSKSTRNAFTASYKAGTKPTQAKNKVKFLWLANVLKTHGQEVSTQKGKIKIKSV